uniref:Protein kinase domain-containing protein n=1 Tax=Globisporangium ultimum (strain ATCC 200006 / CBS 805.95 / DAOM BR144) TaxID=431595 RepID=K3WJA3_GLOUD
MTASLIQSRGGVVPVAEAVSGYVPVDYGFEFNGKHSDFAQQYYLRYMAKDEVSPLTAIKTGNLPDALQTELKMYALSWEELPGLLQRALLWDTGYALTADSSTIVPIYTRNNRSMAEIFVPRKAYERTGCTPRACSLPNGEIFYRHKWCDGDQMARVSLCAVDGDKTSPHAAMWGDGGEVDTIPEVRVMRHYWRDHGDEYLMYALHTLADEAVYDKCPATPAMVIPCVSNASVPDPENWGPPTRGKVVEAWLKKYAEDHQENRTWLLVPLTIVVFTLFGVITVYRFKAAVREPLDDDDSTFTKNDLDFDSGSVEAFLTSPRGGTNDDSDSNNDVERHPEGDLNAAAFEYFDASIGLSASAFDPMMMASHPRIHPLQRSARSMWGKVHASKRNEVAIRSFRLFESHRKIRQLRVPFREIQVTKLLSSGATGEVWLATHRARQVAVKQLLPAKRRKLKEMEMFMAEIYLLAQLKHDNIVSLLGIATS